MNKPLVYFFSDFGGNGPYTAQVESIIRNHGQAEFIELLNNAPATDPYRSSYLLAAIYNNLPVKQGYLLAVVDPGVGSHRNLISFKHEDMTFIGPDNGLLTGIIRGKNITHVNKHKSPAKLASDSFHARDWFAPVLVEMIKNQTLDVENLPVNDIVGLDWPDQLGEVIYIDHYGNLITGIQANEVKTSHCFKLKDTHVYHARTFSSVRNGNLLWYANSMGLIEIAANQTSAALITGYGVGDEIT